MDKRLEEEYERTIHCLSMTTEVKIRTIVETQLIANNLKTLMEVKKKVPVRKKNSRINPV